MPDILETKPKLFDQWPQRYDRWFETPIGRLVYQYERALIFEMLQPARNENILDVGCGTGIFTADILETGACVTGLELSRPMLVQARRKAPTASLEAVAGDMGALPFASHSFHKVVSVTALEFVADAETAVAEMFRITRPGGIIVVATLNSLSPWAKRRRKAADRGHPIFQQATFRSPDEIRALAPQAGAVRTAIHFQKDDEPSAAELVEARGRRQGLDTGAFLAARWQKP